MTLHVLLNPRHLASLNQFMSDEDELILGGAAVKLEPEHFPGKRCYALATDCAYWQVEPPQAELIDDAQWVRRVLQAERVIHW